MNFVKKGIIRLKRKIKRAWFVLGQRKIKRVHSRIKRTPRIKGKRLVLKRAHEKPEIERAWRKRIAEWHARHQARTYTLALSKRFPPIQGQRVEVFRDLPTLGDVLLSDVGYQKPGSRVLTFLKKNNVDAHAAVKMGTRVWHEFDHNLENILRGAGNPRFPMDLHPYQFLVERIEKNGRMHLILVDV
ncbi:MAG: hypothetical protein HY393_02585 [Candidatus Diapherotrites archaeon]|nr:hypothetical protein [Candidatus Diapherotrites archaeon]